MTIHARISSPWMESRKSWSEQELFFTSVICVSQKFPCRNSWKVNKTTRDWRRNNGQSTHFVYRFYVLYNIAVVCRESLGWRVRTARHTFRPHSYNKLSENKMFVSTVIVFSLALISSSLANIGMVIYVYLC